MPSRGDPKSPCAYAKRQLDSPQLTAAWQANAERRDLRLRIAMQRERGRDRSGLFERKAAANLNAVDTPLVLRHESDLGEWESVTRRPAPSLREYVHRYQGWLEATPGTNRRREVPTGEVVLIINLGEPFHVLNPKDPGSAATPLRSFTSGVSDSYVLTESSRSMHVLQVDFTPVGAHLFFGLPMHSLSNRAVQLEDVLGWAAIRLEARLRQVRTWDARFAQLDRFIERRFAVTASPDAGLVWAMRRLRETGGCASIGGLAVELGWTNRRLIEAFREHVGLGPKTMARIIRFNRVTRLIRQGTPVRWADIAYRCGYYDQAHLVHDFKQFSGLTPTEFLAREKAGALSD